ncbi:MAG: PIN domain-containing protein [Verrucomicrobiae bacterium]|nr:PIN domain-containing protein [Verrucomicrobiae bacterium]
MKFIVDTSVWSEFLRRKDPESSAQLEILRQGIRQQNVQMLGIVRQELLSGIKEKSQFRKIRDILEGFPDLLATSDDHLLAAEFFNRCRSKGIQGSPVDFLICAQASRNNMRILAADKDYEQYAVLLPLELVT